MIGWRSCGGKLTSKARPNMMHLPPRRELASATCIYATVGYKPPDLGEVMAGNSNEFWLYTSPVRSFDEAILTLTGASYHNYVLLSQRTCRA